MLMFPQLIAGPILRYATVASSSSDASYGISTSSTAAFSSASDLAQKVLIADTIAGVADPLFAHWQSLSTATAWLAMIAYAFQIYFDFAGYSNMAIGLALMMRFRLPENFD